MSAQKMMVHAVDPDGKWLYRVGGISALILAIAYIITIPLYVYVGAPPSGGEARLKYLALNTTVWWAILGLSVLTDFLFVPVALSLYLALKGVNRNAMLVATAFVGLFIVLDLAVTWSNYASLITLSGNYAAATNDAQRAAYVAAASYPSAVLASSLEAVYSHGHPWDRFGSGPFFCKYFECNHNHHFRSHHSLGLVCRLQTLQARSAVIPMLLSITKRPLSTRGGSILACREQQVDMS